MTGDLSKIYKKIGATRANINFLTRCRKYKLIPKGFLSKSRISTKKSTQMESRFARVRMREMLNSLHAKLFLLDLDLQAFPNKHSYKYSHEQLLQIQDRTYFTRMKILNKKFSHMMATRPDRPPVKYKLEAVLNLSSKDLTEDEARVLARGFKFRPTLTQLPIKDIIISTEALIKTAKIAPNVATRMRTKVAKEIDRMQDRERRRPTKQNLTTKEWKAVKNLKMDQERIIIPADKGDKSIVMDYAAKEDKYDAEDDATAILENQTYLDKLDDRIQGHIQVDQDPAIKHEKPLMQH